MGPGLLPAFFAINVELFYQYYFNTYVFSGLKKFLYIVREMVKMSDAEHPGLSAEFTRFQT
jgi:hypothetical protein